MLRQMNDEVHAYSGLARVGIVPSAEAPSSRQKKIKIIKQICRFGAVNFTKMRLAAGLSTNNRLYNTIQYNTKFVKRHVAVASEALANRSVRKQRRRRTNVL